MTELSFEDIANLDLRPFALRATLQSLKIRAGALARLEDVPGFSELRFLHKLELPGNHLREVSPLAEFKNLTYLNIGDNEIADLAPIADLTRLEYLDFGGNTVRSLTPLYGLSRLTLLVGSNNQLMSSPAPAGTWPVLQEIYMINNQLTDLDFLRDATSLKRRAFSGNPLPVAN